MPNMLDYIEETKQLTFKERPFNHVDMLVLTELSYLPFDSIVPYELDVNHGLAIGEFQEPVKNFRKKQEEDEWATWFMLTHERVDLIDALTSSKRFKDIILYGYVNDINLDNEKQFCAVAYKLNQDTSIVAFRGTDDNLVGWKEDSNMTYMTEVPAQTSARNYLKKVMDTSTDTFQITGHSKGGNLSLYAAYAIDKAYQERIEAVYCFDSPGLHPGQIASEEYQSIKAKVKAYLPQDSVVGMFLDRDRPHNVIKSNARGLMQHSAFSWQIENGDFIYLDDVTKRSHRIDRMFKTWTDTLPEEDLANFWDTFFELLYSTGSETLEDLANDFPKRLNLFLKNKKKLDKTEQEMLMRVAWTLLSIDYQEWSADLAKSLPKFELPSMEEWLAQLNPPKKRGIILPNELSSETQKYQELYKNYHKKTSKPTK